MSMDTVSVAIGKDVVLPANADKYIQRDDLFDEAEYLGIQDFTDMTDEALREKIDERKKFFSNLLGVEFPVIGFSHHRLIEGDNYYDKEVALARVFNRWNTNRLGGGFTFFDYMTGTSDGVHPNDFLGERELRLLATFAQWLGTPVGRDFLREANII
jgi:hypothetical protein